jgi:hypothetical protein
MDAAFALPHERFAAEDDPRELPQLPRFEFSHPDRAMVFAISDRFVDAFNAYRPELGRGKTIKREKVAEVLRAFVLDSKFPVKCPTYDTMKRHLISRIARLRAADKNEPAASGANDKEAPNEAERKVGVCVCLLSHTMDPA